jgi:hypothetical protein
MIVGAIATSPHTTCELEKCRFDRRIGGFFDDPTTLGRLVGGLFAVFHQRSRDF